MLTADVASVVVPPPPPELRPAVTACTYVLIAATVAVVCVSVEDNVVSEDNFTIPVPVDVAKLTDPPPAPVVRVVPSRNTN